MKPSNSTCAIILDLMMPVMDGFEFRRRQLQQPVPLASIPVICISAIVSEAGSFGIPCLAKPVDPCSLVQLVREYCPRSEHFRRRLADSGIPSGDSATAQPRATAATPTAGRYLNTYVREQGRWMIAGTAAVPEPPKAP